MVRRAVVRPLMFGALVTGLVPLTSAGVGGAAVDESPAGVCSSTFGERGPVDASVAGEGPSGDPMPVTIAWNPADWPAGLRDVITCVSVDGRGVPSLARAQGAPPNTGTFNFDLTLPVGEPGAVVCEQNVLIGAGSGGEQRRSTDAMCFKLRDGGPPPAEPSGGDTIGDTPVTPPARTPRVGSGATPPARIDAGAPAPSSPPPAVASPADHANPAGPPALAHPPRRGADAPEDPAAAPPRTPTQLLPGAWSGPWARGAMGTTSRSPRSSRAAAGPAAPAPTVVQAPAPGEAARRMRPSSARAAAPVPAPASGTRQAATGRAPSGAPDAEAPRAALARTGISDRVPLAAGGSLLALGGAAIVLAEPRRRACPARR